MASQSDPLSEETAAFIVPIYPYDVPRILESSDSLFDFVSPEYLIRYRPLRDVLPLSAAREGYESIPNLYALLDSSIPDLTGIRQTLAAPRLGNGGAGALIGIVDTGIDYTSPLFRDPDGKTRILGLWDQTVPGPGLAGSGPLEAIRYGTVYRKEDLDQALASPDPLSAVPSLDSDGHGTRMAAAAAGYSEDPAFSGAAPQAGLLIVRLRPASQYLRDFYLIRDGVPAFQENDIMLGVKYLLSAARALNRPLVVLLGLGTNTGSHNGTSPLALYLASQNRSGGLVIVTAAGNETGFGHHYRGRTKAEETFEDVELRVGEEETGFTLEFWARESELYSVGFLSPSGEETGRLSVSGDPERRLSFLLEPTEITLTYAASEAATGSELILMRFYLPSPGIWKIRVFHTLSIQGEYHMWLPVRGFISDRTFFLRPDPDATITDPGNAAALITAAAYNPETGGICLHSSRGFTRTGAIKPDLAAPGAFPPADAALFPASGQTEADGAALTPESETDFSSLRDQLFDPAARPPETCTTSLAAACTAGACAILLSWAVSSQNAYVVNTPVAKSILIRGARRRPGAVYPNREWGYGILDLYQSFLAMRD